jgi:hypothetical protein
LNKGAEDARKHISRKDGGVANDMKLMINLIKGFNPSFPTFTSIDEIMDTEFTFTLKMKSALSPAFELQFTLFHDNSRPFSMTSIYDHNQSISAQQDQCFFFVNIPMKAIMTSNLALIVKVIEKR